MADKTIGSDWLRYFQAVQQQVLDWNRDHPKATWAELDAAVWRQLSGVHTRMMEDVVAARPLASFSQMPEDERPRCSECGDRLQSRGAKTRKLRSVGQEMIRLERAEGVCPTCGRAFFPSGP